MPRGEPTTAQHAFEKATAWSGDGPLHRSDRFSIEERAEAEFHARVIVERLVAMHCGVARAADWAFNPTTQEYKAACLATGRWRDLATIVPGRMRRRDWAMGYRVACHLGWLEGAYLGRGDFYNEDYFLSCVSEAGLGANLITAERYRADVLRIQDGGARWFDVMSALDVERKALRPLTVDDADWSADADGDVRLSEAIACLPGDPREAESALRERLAFLQSLRNQAANRIARHDAMVDVTLGELHKQTLAGHAVSTQPAVAGSTRRSL